MIPLARVYARVLLRRWSTWAVIAGAVLVAMVGVSLDLFGFDGSPSRSAGMIVGTFEIGAILLAVSGRLSGVASEDSEGFRAAIVQAMGATAVDLGATIGVAVAAGAVSWLGVGVVFVFYMYMGQMAADVPRAFVVALALMGESAVAAAWAGIGARVAGRVAGAATGMAAFAIARLDVPLGVRACLPAPLPSDVAGMLVSLGTAALAATGLVLVTGALPAVGEGSP